MNQPLDQELLAVLRAHLGEPGAQFAVAPRSLGGSFSQVYRFELAELGEPWRGPLVLRLGPEHTGPERLHLERAIQDGLAAAGFPAPRVLLADDGLRISDRPFLILEHLPGRSFLRGIRPGQFALDLPHLLTSWGHTAARVLARLHDLDPDAVVGGLVDGRLDGSVVSTRRHVTRTIDTLDQFGGPGLADAVDWLREHEPARPERVSIVHGDLWPGNVLLRRRTLTGVIDWDRTGIGDPALDVGFARAGLSLMPAPFPPPPPIAGGVHLAGRLIAQDLDRAYRKLRPLDPSRVAYYESLRCALELAPVVTYRHRRAHGHVDGPPPPWDAGADALVQHFTAASGVAVRLDAAG